MHLEGEVSAVEGSASISVEMQVTRGSAPKGLGVVTRLSERWVTFSGSELPSRGDTIRVTDASYVEGSANPAVFKADRVATAVWHVSL